MRGLRLGLGLGGYAAAGGAGPVLLAAPAITGSVTQNSLRTYDVGLWSGASPMTFEIEVTQTSPTATPLARQAVTGTTTGTITEAVGGSLVLNVWATDASGTTLASSAVFGPVIAAGDTFVRGIVINPSTAVSPPSGWNLSAPDPNGNPYSGGAGWGWVGSGVGGATGDADFSSQSHGDVRINGRFINNVNAATLGIRVDLPDGAGVYKIYAGFGAASTVTPKLEIRDGSSSAAASLATINVTSPQSITSAQTMDAAGVITTHANWVLASAYGGTPIEVTATGTSLWFGRDSSNGAPIINCLAILKKAP